VVRHVGSGSRRVRSALQTALQALLRFLSQQRGDALQNCAKRWY